MRDKFYGMVIFLSVCLFLFSSKLIYAQSYDYNILVKDAKILDVSLKKAFKTDVAIKDDIIVKVSK